MSELLSCPFCGGEAELKHNKTWDYFVRCKSCGVRTRQHHENHIGAEMDWNSRAERTCKPTEEDCCPYCGEDLVRCNVGIGELGGAVELDPPIYHNYCPNCGRKVKQ